MGSIIVAMATVCLVVIVVITKVGFVQDVWASGTNNLPCLEPQLCS